MSALRVVAGTFANAAVYALLLFVPTWTWNWPRAWILVGAVFAGMLVTRLWVFRTNPELLAERRKPPLQAGQPAADKWLVIAFMTIFPAYIMFIPIDVFRLHLLAAPPPPVSLAGFGVCGAGWWIISLAFRANSFAAAIVTHQAERSQTVVDNGVYGMVRHPLYSGVVLIVVGIALWLQSTAAALLAVVPIAVIVLRILVEEDFLKRRLAGYEAYTRRVGYRLIPRIW
jgi:protein-S-isoprenylcysteine O-methyltransferase Ste14